MPANLGEAKNIKSLDYFLVQAFLMQVFSLHLFVGKLAAADAVDFPAVNYLAILYALEQHSVGVEGKEYIRFPYELKLGNRLKFLNDCNVGHVSLACCGKAAVECHAVAVYIGTAFGKLLCCAVRTHGVAARRAKANPEK